MKLGWTHQFFHHAELGYIVLFPTSLNLSERKHCTTVSLRNFKVKIGMNTTANKFYHINNLIGLDMLNLEFVNFKKLAKIPFLKYGNTWSSNPNFNHLITRRPDYSMNGHEPEQYEAMNSGALNHYKLSMFYPINCVITCCNILYLKL